MSCLNGSDCLEPAKRRMALVILAVMLGIFLLLSVFSFVPSRTQAVPQAVSFDGVNAVDGKRVFQAYNCMGCHTIVGNGAYFGPDLTKVYGQVGPAWLAAFLPSASGWPTKAAVQVQLSNPAIQKAAGVTDMDAYLQRFPGAVQRLDERGGQRTLMPNLPFSALEVKELIAFLRYTSEMHNEGWPPKPNPARKLPAAVQAVLAVAPAGAAPVSGAAAQPVSQTSGASSSGNLVVKGQKLVADMGCVACHATDKKRVVGPGWGGLYDSEVTLADGAKVKADDAYLIESVRNPDAKIAEGYPPHVMPTYDSKLISDDDLKAIVAYLRSLKG